MKAQIILPGIFDVADRGWCVDVMVWLMEVAELKGHALIWHGPRFKITPPIDIELPSFCRSEIIEDQTEHLDFELAKCATEMYQRSWRKDEKEKPKKPSRYDYMAAFVHYFSNLSICEYDEEGRFWKEYAKRCVKNQKRLKRMTRNQIIEEDGQSWEVSE